MLAIQQALPNVEDSTKNVTDDDCSNLEDGTTKTTTELDEEDGGEDIAGSKFNALIKDLKDKNVSTVVEIETLVVEWCQDCLAGNDDPRVLSLFENVLPIHIARLVELEQARRAAKVRVSFVFHCRPASGK